jgi:hypothetical protein
MVRSAMWWHHNHRRGLENPTLIEKNQIKKKHHDYVFYIKLYVQFGSKSWHGSAVWRQKIKEN